MDIQCYLCPSRLEKNTLLFKSWVCLFFFYVLERSFFFYVKESICTIFERYSANNKQLYIFKVWGL